MVFHRIIEGRERPSEIAMPRSVIRVSAIRRHGPPLAYKRFEDLWSAEETEGA
jgi:hypothetical protein